MQASFSPPCPFLEHPGQPTIAFRIWIRLFENYLLAAFPEKIGEKRKRAILLNHLGTEGQRLFYSLQPTDDSYASTLQALTSFFTPKVNVCVERHRFRRRRQAQGETVDLYVADLKELAATCAFGALEEESIRDQLIEGTSSPAVRERLLSVDNLTLDKAILIAQQMETAKREASCLLATADGTDVNLLKKRQQSAPSSGSVARKNAGEQTTQKYCFRCGSTTHLANASDCHARNSQCYNCGKRGHLSKVCKSKQLGRPKRKVCSSVQMLELAQLSKADSIYITIEVSYRSNYYPLQFMVDTGSPVSVIPRSLWQTTFASAPLRTPPVTLTSYCKRPLPILGCFDASVKYKGKRARTTFYVARYGKALIGMDLIGELNIRIHGSDVVSNVAVTTSEGRTNAKLKNYVHEVKIKRDIKPVKQKLRRLPLLLREAVAKEIHKLLSTGIIEKIDASEWVSPIVVTRKKDGNIRLCVDLREPNKAIVPDIFPLPHIDDLLLRFKGATIFSALDLRSAYHQLVLHENSRDITAFISHVGLFRFCRVPYGLCSAPAAFQKVMTDILRGLPGVVCYLDDIVVFGKTKSEHDRNLSSVLQRLQCNGLVLNDDKCKWSQNEILFLGHHISSAGIRPDFSRIEAVLNAPAPSSIQSLRSFIGMMTWYSKFIPNLSSTIEPLRALIRNADSTFCWNTTAEESFQKLKHLLLESPALALFEPRLATVVTTDASGVGIGAVLSQIQEDGNERTIAFASRALSLTERKYSVVEKEALACVWAVEKWRHWLWGTKFTLCSDQRSLTTLLTSKGIDRASLRIARWSMKLMEFNYDIKYKPGSANSVADALSRLPVEKEPTNLEHEEDVVAYIRKEIPAVNSSELAEATSKCPVLSEVSRYIQEGWPENSKNLNAALIPFFRVRSELTTQNGVIRGTARVIVPSALQGSFLALAHESHQGIVRTKARLRQLFWWPGLDREVEMFVRNCTICQTLDKTAVQYRTPLTPVPLQNAAWEKVAIDIVGPLHNSRYGERFAITLIDYYGKWPEVKFCQKVTTGEVIRFLKEVFSREGQPKEIVSDNGVQFTSHEFQEFLQGHAIRHYRSSLYYPQANGEIERFNRTLKDSLQAAARTGCSRSEVVLDFLMHYRATPHAVTGETPSTLLHGRKLKTKLDMTLDDLSLPKSDDLVRRKVERKQQYMAKYFERKKAIRDPNFKDGEMVRVRLPRKFGKQFAFSKPVPIVCRVKRGTYRLKDGRVYNASNLTR
uniref:RNA-directed DNA polymerase n=1 Tax=Trichuris muris TaxID=70415 RepID=A0A5S6QCG5_TRIMR